MPKLKSELSVVPFPVNYVLILFLVLSLLTYREDTLLATVSAFSFALISNQKAKMRTRFLELTTGPGPSRACLVLPPQFVVKENTEVPLDSDDDANEQVTSVGMESESTVSEEVEFMATFVANRLGRILLNKMKMKEKHSVSDSDETQLSEEVPPSPPVLSDSQTPVTDIEPSIETVAKDPLPDESVPDSVEADPLPDESVPDSIEADPLPAKLSTVDSLSLPDELDMTGSAESDVEESSEILQSNSTVLGKCVTLVPSLPPEISLSFGRALEVLQERIPPLQIPVLASKAA